MKKLLVSVLVVGCCSMSVGFADEHCDALAAGILKWQTGDVMSTYKSCDYQTTTVVQPYKNHLTYTLSDPTDPGCAHAITRTAVVYRCGDGPAGDEDYLEGIDDAHKNAVTGTIYKKTDELRLVDTYMHTTVDAKLQ